MKFFINFKTYQQGTGKNALKLLKQLEKSKLDVTACLQPCDIYLSAKTKIDVWAQHVDAVNYGSSTGWILPESAKENGAKGVLINHSEHRVSNIGEIVKRCKDIGLKTMVLVPTAEDVLKVKGFHPDYIGVEPPELIGSKTYSIASRPELIKASVKNAGNIPLFVGAGVKEFNDIKVSEELNAKGVLIASAVVTAEDPLKVLNSLYK